MRRHILSGLFGILAGLLMGIIFFYHLHNNAQAQEIYGAKLQNFAYLQAFFSGNNLGFFDTREAKIYIYDMSTNSCTKILQLRQLGNPLWEIRK
ncbi:MAG: hypothetical protein NC818_04120 [Candidatus Omnitrophica bacterium]|nr:hypothetical protein [Candidatus Omnitrophota bacterium]MCM8783944.1 hypothetical protein [Candidatus Omnitrophota bacterium]